MATKTTRGAHGGGSIRKRSDGRWEGRYSLGTDSKTGKQIQKSVYGKTQKEVRQKLAKITTEIDEGTYIEPTKMKVGEWLDQWLDEYSSDKKFLTVKGYRAQSNTHIKPALGEAKLASLTPMMVQTFYNELSTPPDGSKGLAPKSVRNVHGVFSKAMNQAVRNGLIRSNPCDGAILPRIEKPKVSPLTDEQIKNMFLLADEDEVYGTLLKIIVLTGLREAEAMGLTWDCVDFEKGILSIEKQLQKRPKANGGIVFASLKNDKARILKPAPYVMELLRQRYDQQIQQRKSAAESWEGWLTEEEHRKALVFTTLTGTYLSPQTVYNHFKKIAAQIGAPDARVHDLRHTYAVLSLQNGDDVKTVQRNLGHATAAFTLDVYGHVSEGMKNASSSRMEQYVRAVINP